jgi:hypothetical protein
MVALNFKNYRIEDVGIGWVYGILNVLRENDEPIICARHRGSTLYFTTARPIDDSVIDRLERSNVEVLNA